MSVELNAKIIGIKYQPLLCRKLNVFDIEDLAAAISKYGAFLLKTKKASFAVSWWVSAKRTRSYPYARVYDTLSFSGKKITIIPVFKDEGEGGDRDFLQWDTISLMSLLGVYVIIAYYVDADINPRFPNKITNQRFDLEYLKSKIAEIAHYQSDALHWNMLQVDEIARISKLAEESYSQISKKTKVKVHSSKGIEKRIQEIIKSRESFIEYSRGLAKRAQYSESQTKHKMENLSGSKGIITIQNYLGGEYYFTVDEIEFHGEYVYLIEGKNTKNIRLPSIEDIKDALLKMVIFCNLKHVKANGKEFKPRAAIKLTTAPGFSASNLPKSQKIALALLYKEAKQNNFEVIINGKREPVL